MDLYPKFYCNRVTDVTVEFLQKNNIKGLILDVDNTLLNTDKIMVEGLIEWHDKIVASGIKTMIVSNSNKKPKLDYISGELNIPYISFATKPLKRGFLKAQKMLELPFEEIAAIGDQIFTDVIGANRTKMFSILVKPLAEKDLWMTRIKRPIEELVIKRYLKKIGG